MSETKKRISAYKEALPGMRERVFAAAVLLLLSMVIITVSSFAWYTLSKAPEVAGIGTQIAGNGNLEIALSGPDGVTPPRESAIGDSSSTEGQTILNSNLTWGNLINLSDPDYGLDKILLRPAVLNNGKLGSEPFRSVIYGEDGRVSHDQNAKFSYCTWEPANQENPTPHFGVTGQFGVRAIATVTERFEADLGGTPEDMIKFDGYLSAAETENRKVDSIYQNDIILDDPSIKALATIMGYYMQRGVNSDEVLRNPECTDQIASLNKLYGNFLRAMQQELNAMATLANVQQFVFTKSDSYTPYTAQTLREATVEKLTAKGVHLTDFDQFITDLEAVETDAELIATMATEVKDIGRQVYLMELRPIIDRLVIVSSCKVDADGQKTTIGAITGYDSAKPLLGASDTNVEIQEGILARFEHRAGTYVYREKLSVSLRVKRELAGMPVEVPITVKADIYTQYINDKTDFLFAQDVAWTQEAFNNSGMSNGRKILTAGDTYGLAVDLWVRTNAGDPETGKSYLTLEGKLLRDQATGTDADGNPVGLLFRYTVEDDLGNETEYYVYQTGDGKWYEDYAHHQSNNEVTAATLSGKIMQVVYKDAPVGYEGENRVWEEIQAATLQPQLSEFNTTQGNGSCYTFYADSPQDQQMILNLLKHMYVVFTDGGDDYMSMARFDTEENHYYAVGGKVTVPLVLTQSKFRYTDADEKGHDAVAELQRGEAKRITALVYLDGKELSNKEALAYNDIQGTLNIQFGNNVVLTTIGDETLQTQERRVTATVETAQPNNVLDFFSNDLTAHVTVNVTGDQPSVVTAFFQREINAFQGSRQATMTFRQEGDSWVCDDFAFPAPGKYVLRSVMLDGVEYDLAEQPEVTVEGVLLRSLNVTHDEQIVLNREKTIMTADNTVTFGLTAEINTTDADKMPDSLIVEFVRKEDGATVPVNMTATTTGWKGTANITSSGYYEMAYVLMDDVRYDLGALGKNFDLYLGLSAVVEAAPGTPQIVSLVDVQDAVTLGIRAKLVDNSGNTVDGLPSFYVYYSSGPSKVMEAEVTWNSISGYYEGEFHLSVRDHGPGIYKFAYLEAQGNRIEAHKSAVVFRASNNKPVSYVGCANDDLMIVIMPGENKVAELQIKLLNADAPQIKATFKNSKGQTYVFEDSDETPLKDPKIEDTNIYVWSIPVTEAGTWHLSELALGNVTDKYEHLYTTEDPMLIQFADGEGPKITLINRIDAVVSYSGLTDFTGAFMEGHAVQGLSVDLGFRDGYGDPLVLEGYKFTDVKLHYRHVTNSERDSYYTYGTVDDIVVEMTDSGNGVTFVQSSDMTLRVAGTYELSAVTYRLEGDIGDDRTTQASATSKATRFVVTSGKPTVTVDSVTPTAGTPYTALKGTHKGTLLGVDRGYDITQYGSNVSTSKTDYSAVVYIKGTVTSGWGGSSYTSELPSVTLKVHGTGEATAKLTFTKTGGGSVLLQTSNSSQSTSGTAGAAYTWAKGVETCTRSLGYVDTSGLRKWLYTAGELKATTLVLTYDGVNYEFPLDNTITLTNNNPG